MEKEKESVKGGRVGSWNWLCFIRCQLEFRLKRRDWKHWDLGKTLHSEGSLLSHRKESQAPRRWKEHTRDESHPKLRMGKVRPGAKEKAVKLVKLGT